MRGGGYVMHSWHKLSYASMGLTDDDLHKLYVDKDLNFCQEVDFSMNKLTSVGLRELLKICNRCHKLRVLKLFKNQIDDRGADDLARLIEESRSIEEIHLSHNKITASGVMLLVNAADRSRPYSAAPLWLRLEKNAVMQPNSLLTKLENELSVCGRHDEKQCTARVCCRRRKVHLPFFTMQSRPAPWATQRGPGDYGDYGDHGGGSGGGSARYHDEGGGASSDHEEFRSRIVLTARSDIGPCGEESRERSNPREQPWHEPQVRGRSRSRAFRNGNRHMRAPPPPPPPPPPMASLPPKKARSGGGLRGDRSPFFRRMSARPISPRRTAPCSSRRGDRPDVGHREGRFRQERLDRLDRLDRGDRADRTARAHRGGSRLRRRRRSAMMDPAGEPPLSRHDGLRRRRPRSLCVVRGGCGATDFGSRPMKRRRLAADGHPANAGHPCGRRGHHRIIGGRFTVHRERRRRHEERAQAAAALSSHPQDAGAPHRLAPLAGRKASVRKAAHQDGFAERPSAPARAPRSGLGDERASGDSAAAGCATRATAPAAASVASGSGGAAPSRGLGLPPVANGAAHAAADRSVSVSTSSEFSESEDGAPGDRATSTAHTVAAVGLAAARQEQHPPGAIPVAISPDSSCSGSASENGEDDDGPVACAAQPSAPSAPSASASAAAPLSAVSLAASAAMPLRATWLAGSSASVAPEEPSPEPPHGGDAAVAAGEAASSSRRGGVGAGIGTCGTASMSPSSERRWDEDRGCPPPSPPSSPSRSPARRRRQAEAEYDGGRGGPATAAGRDERGSDAGASDGDDACTPALDMKERMESLKEKLAQKLQRKQEAAAAASFDMLPLPELDMGEL